MRNFETATKTSGDRKRTFTNHSYTTKMYDTRQSEMFTQPGFVGRPEIAERRFI